MGTCIRSAEPCYIGYGGVDAYYLKVSQLWWKDPKCLRKGKEYWPPKFLPESSSELVSEKGKVNVTLVVQEDPTRIGNVID